MNKNTWIVILVIVAFGIVFLAFNSSKKEETTPVGPATISNLSITDDVSSAGVVLAGAKIINWQTVNYPVSAGVNINLIRKISDSPKEFTLVRALGTNTPNDGAESWTLQNGENTGDLYVEVTCSNSYVFKAGCSLATEPAKVN